MVNYYPVLKKVMLFDGIDEADIGSLLKCLSAIGKKFNKGDIIYMDGDTILHVGIVLSG